MQFQCLLSKQFCNTEKSLNEDCWKNINTFGQKTKNVCIYYLFYEVGAHITLLCSAAPTSADLPAFNYFLFQSIWNFATPNFFLTFLCPLILFLMTNHSAYIFTISLQWAGVGGVSLAKVGGLWDYPPMWLVKCMRNHSSISNWS